MKKSFETHDKWAADSYLSTIFFSAYSYPDSSSWLLMSSLKSL